MKKVCTLISVILCAFLITALLSCGGGASSSSDGSLQLSLNVPSEAMSARSVSSARASILTGCEVAVVVIGDYYEYKRITVGSSGSVSATFHVPKDSTIDIGAAVKLSEGGRDRLFLKNTGDFVVSEGGNKVSLILDNYLYATSNGLYWCEADGDSEPAAEKDLFRKGQAVATERTVVDSEGNSSTVMDIAIYGVKLGSIKVEQ